jgi:DNA polymerase II large subunit
MHVTNSFLAIGTQLKLERPGKGCTVTPCQCLDGPIVELIDGTVLQLNDEESAKEVMTKIKRIIFLGDMLVNYGAFKEHGHALVPGATLRSGGLSNWQRRRARTILRLRHILIFLKARSMQ